MKILDKLAPLLPLCKVPNESQPINWWTELT